MGFLFMDSRSRVKKAERGEGTEQAPTELEEYLEEHKEEIIGVLLILWADQRTALAPEEIQAAIEEKDVPHLLLKAWRQDYTHLVKKALEPLWKAAAEAGRKAAEKLELLRIVSVYDQEFLDTDLLVLKWIREHGAELVTNSTEAQKQSIRWLLRESVNGKMSAEQLAGRIRQTIGLTKPQAAANQRYYMNILDRLRRERPDMDEKAILQKARAAAERYRQKQLRSRALTIARTEIAMAYNQGQDAAVRHYIKLGYIGPKVRKIWVAARGDRACEICKELDGHPADIDESITAVYKKTVRKKEVERTASSFIPPAHPRCACSLKYEEVEEG